MDVTFNSQSAGMANVATGSATSDNTGLNVRLGFKPRVIKLINVTDLLTWEWVEGMPAATVLLTTGSTGVITANDTGAIVVDDKGFTVSQAGAGNAKSLLFYAMA